MRTTTRAIGAEVLVWMRASVALLTCAQLTACQCGLFERYSPERTYNTQRSVTAEQLGQIAYTPDGRVSNESCARLCNHWGARCVLFGAQDDRRLGCSGTAGGYCYSSGCMYGCGRAPDGVTLPACEGATPLGRYLARMTQLEGASVLAFESFARELAAHGAPRRFVTRARRAARDEVRHTRGALAQARRFGAAAPEPEVPAARVRSLEVFALENACEGCVRESFAALLAGVQAERARDPALRALFATVARDEARHAALAWEVDAWARARLDPAARERVADAQREALDALGEASAIEGTAGDVLRDAGVPDAGLYRACVARFRERFRFEPSARPARGPHRCEAPDDLRNRAFG